MSLARDALTAAVVVGAIPWVFAACDSSTEPLTPAQVAPAALVEQAGEVANPVATTPAVRVLTTAGRPVPGVVVTFTVAAGGGSIVGAHQTTDADGVAALADWVLGTVAGENIVVASVPAMADAAVVFRAAAAAGPATGLVITTQPPGQAVRGIPLAPPPMVRLVDVFGNPTGRGPEQVTALAEQAGVDLVNAIAIRDASGLATFSGLTLLAEPGTYTLRFAAGPAITGPATAAIQLLNEAPGSCGPVLPLDFQLGETVRTSLADPRGLACLGFDTVRNAGQQYLLLLENMPATGDYGSGLFPGLPAQARFDYTVHGTPAGPAALYPTPVAGLHGFATTAAPPARASHAWDFGAGPIYEIEPAPPPGGAPPPMLVRPAGLVDLNSVTASALAGDTVQVWMEGIPRLGIATGNQRAVIRYVDDLLIIAEDVRLGTSLRRQSGGFNTPLHPDTMLAIAQQYAAQARVQGDLLFDGRHNAAVENANGGRVLAVHSVMPEDDIWGYTYSSTSYFVWDYWVGTNGSAGGLNQRVQRNADNLFMHEIAHMRHLGLLQHANVPPALRGNRWLVEGFARFSERLPIAARLLGTANPSRTANVVLPLNPAFGNAYFRDDVPTFLNASTSMFEGYQHSSFVFDYFVDQLALQGDDWRAGLRAFLLAAGSQTSLDAVVFQRLGLSFGELFTRARTALYLDDIGTTGLPPWTQYHQFQLRASRPAGSLSASDPRNAWTRLHPGFIYQVNGAIQAGSAWGFIIDGTQATASSTFRIDGPPTANAVMSVTRIR
jgi:hypothetical protein